MKLTNRDIFTAVPAGQQLCKNKFPPKVSFGLADLQTKLENKAKPIEKVRLDLVDKYGQELEGGRGKTVIQFLDVKVNEGTEHEYLKQVFNPAYDSFIKDFNEVLDVEIDFNFDKVKLPEKMTITCDKCKQSTETLREIEPNIIKDLLLFVELA